MEKFIELLTTLGIKQETIDKIKNGEEVDLNEVSTSFLAEKAALVKNDAAFVNDLKAQAKKEGEIVATKQFKKLLNKEFGLSLTETPLMEISNEDIIKKVKETSTTAANADVQKLQEQIITLTNEKTTLENDITLKVKETEDKWSSKWKQQQIDKALSEIVDSMELIVSKQTAIKNLKMEIVDNGYDFEFDDNGKVVKIKKGDLQAVQPDNKGFETLESLRDRSLTEFVKKSNGSGGAGGNGGAGGTGGTGGGAVADNLEDVPDTVLQHLEQMKKNAGLATA